MSADRHDDVSGVVGRVGSSGPLGALGGLVLVVIAALGLREVASLVVPVLFGLLIALTVWPLVGSLERRGFRHALALASSILVVLALVLLGALTAALSVAQLAAEIPNYETQLTVALAGLGELLGQALPLR